MLTWLLGRSSADYVEPWNAVRADQHAEETARMLLGACGRPRVVGNRVHEALLADREARAARMGTGKPRANYSEIIPADRRRERRFRVAS